MKFLVETVSFLSSNSLISTIVTFYALLFLYLPRILSQFLFSPVVLTTLILLLHLLRLGAAQQSVGNQTESCSGESELSSPGKIQDIIVDRDLKCGSPPSGIIPGPELRFGYDPDPFFPEWGVGSPLEVIYEEHEGEDGEENDGGVSDVIQRYASLSLFYPESDSDSEGNCSLPENAFLRWEDEDDDREGLIEIALDEKMNRDVDEENLIEIDISRGE